MGLVGILRKNKMKKKNPFAKNQPWGDISTVNNAPMTQAMWKREA